MLALILALVGLMLASKTVYAIFAKAKAPVTRPPSRYGNLSDHDWNTDDTQVYRGALPEPPATKDEISVLPWAIATAVAFILAWMVHVLAS